MSLSHTFADVLSRLEIAQDQLSFDGEFHAVSNDNFKGWYIGRRKEIGKGLVRVLQAGDWRTGEKLYAQDSNLERKSKRELEQIFLEEKSEIEAKKRVKNEETRLTCQKDWDAYVSVGVSNSAYATKKKIDQLYGAKVAKTQHGQPILCIPMRDTTGMFWGMQKIYDDGAKYFSEGQRIEGVFHKIGEYNPKQPIIICEGFATGVSLHKATKFQVICALTASNLEPVAQEYRRMLPKAKILICGDDDQFREKNMGRTKAVSAAVAVKATCVFPEFKDLTHKPTDFNDLELSEGILAVKEQLDKCPALAPDEIIGTELTGFHNVEFRKGQEVFIPNLDDLAEFFNRKHPFVSLSQSERVFGWNGKHLFEVEELYLKNFAEKHFDPKPTSHTVREFVDKIKRINIASEDAFQKKSRHFVNLQNGVLDCRTLKLLPHSMEYGCRTVLSYNYDPEALCPNFDKLLHNIFKSDMEQATTVLEFIGYALSADEYWYQKALILEGSGANGKSTLLDIIRALLGTANVTSYTLPALNIEANLANLDGKLANISEENPTLKLLDSSALKVLTSGGTIAARQLYQKGFTLVSHAKMIIACNELPESSDTSLGFFRRFHIVSCKEVFDTSRPDYDPYIKDKIIGELAGIFNKALGAYILAKGRGNFTEAKTSKEERQNYAADVDYFSTWVKESLKIHPLGNGHDHIVIPVRKLYAEFALEVQKNNFPRTSIMRFSQKLKHLIRDIDDRRVDSKDENRKTYKGLRGIELLSGDDF